MSSPSSVGAVRELVRRLRDEPEDEETQEVLADWCEERGFTETAQGLRAGSGEMAQNRALTALRLLFGEDGHGSERGSYDAVIGFPLMIIAPHATVTIRTQPQILIRLRRVYISDRINGHLLVHEVRAGKYHLFASGDPVPASVFGTLMPDLFDATVQVNQYLTIIVENISNVEVGFSGCGLGIDGSTYEKRARAQREQESLRNVPDLNIPSATPPLFPLGGTMSFISEKALGVFDPLAGSRSETQTSEGVSTLDEGPSSLELVPCNCPDGWFPADRQAELRKMPHSGWMSHHEACAKRLLPNLTRGL